MAVIFCNDDGSNTAPHDTWAKAATTLLVAVTALAAGDDIHLGADHSEDPAGNVTYAFPGTAVAPNRVISVTVGTAVYNKADNIQVSNAVIGRDITITGHVKFYGVSLLTSDDMVGGGSPQDVLFDDSIIELTSANSDFRFGSANGRNTLSLKNTDMNWSGGGASAAFKGNASWIFNWRGGVLSWSGVQPSALFDEKARNVFISVAGVDLSAITSALVDVSDNSTALVEFHHCLLGASVALTTGTILSADTKVLMSGCDDLTGNDLFRFKYVDFYGSIVHDDVIFLTGGAQDGTTNIAWKLVTTANAKEFSEPLISPPLVAWVDGTGSKTFTVEVVRDSASALRDADAWLEVEFLDSASDVDSAFANDGLANILATAVNQASSAAAWTGTGGFSFENTQKLEVTVPVGRVGLAIGRIHLAKPSTTMYANPKMTVA